MPASQKAQPAGILVLPMTKNFTDLSGKVAVVIGGTSGLGRAIALAYAAAGANVVATGPRPSDYRIRSALAKVSTLGASLRLHIKMDPRLRSLTRAWQHRARSQTHLPCPEQTGMLVRNAVIPA